MNQPFDWRVALQEWLKTNSKQMPDELKALHEEFLRHFPRNHISELTLEEYALGHSDSKDSFCYWLEWETQPLGSVRGGSSAKWGIWWNQNEGSWSFNKFFPTTDPQEIMKIIRESLDNLLSKAEEGQFGKLDKIGDSQLGSNRNSLRAKPLHMYLPDDFLPIANPVHLANILRYFGQEPKKGLHARNRQLLTFLRTLPEFNGFDTVQMMRFLYAYDLFQKKVVFKNEDALEQTILYFVRLANTPQYKKDEYDYKENLLNALNKVLALVPGENPSALLAGLSEWITSYRNEINNLTSWQTRDIFNQYLTAVPAEQIQLQLQALLDEDGDLQERVDTFRDGFEAYYKQYIEGDENLSLGFISLILMGANPEVYMIYRASIISRACEDWGVKDFVTGHRNDGEKYVQLQALVPLLQAKLTKALDRKADLIDVHSLLWFNYTDYYDEFKHRRKADVLEERPFMRDLLRITQRTKNIILYGPPGTGKTYWAQQYSNRIGPDRTRFVTFHQSIAYEEFVEGLKPNSSDGQIAYYVKPGIFRDICRQAALDPDNEYLLVIDEINRANIAKVFGELITLIEDDKRLGAANEIMVTLPYSGEQFGIPENLTILGTMNTADRSIALLDIALRRRFTFIGIMPNPQQLTTDVQGVMLEQLLESLNKRITFLLDQEHQIGHSYFMHVKNLADLRFVWKHRIVPLLQEYFYNDGERLQLILGSKFVILESPGEMTNLSDRYDFGNNHYQLPELSDEAFLAALQDLIYNEPSSN